MNCGRLVNEPHPAMRADHQVSSPPSFCSWWICSWSRDDRQRQGVPPECRDGQHTRDTHSRDTAGWSSRCSRLASLLTRVYGLPQHQWHLYLSRKEVEKRFGTLLCSVQHNKGLNVQEKKNRQINQNEIQHVTSKTFTEIYVQMIWTQWKMLLLDSKRAIFAFSAAKRGSRRSPKVTWPFDKKKKTA